VRAHILEAELATMFDPETAEALRNANLQCNKCTEALGFDKTNMA